MAHGLTNGSSWYDIVECTDETLVIRCRYFVSDYYGHAGSACCMLLFAFMTFMFVGLMITPASIKQLEDAGIGATIVLLVILVAFLGVMFWIIWSFTNSWQILTTFSKNTETIEVETCRIYVNDTPARGSFRRKHFMFTPSIKFTIGRKKAKLSWSDFPCLYLDDNKNLAFPIFQGYEAQAKQLIKIIENFLRGGVNLTENLVEESSAIGNGPEKNARAKWYKRNPKAHIPDEEVDILLALERAAGISIHRNVVEKSIDGHVTKFKERRASHFGLFYSTANGMRNLVKGNYFIEDEGHVAAIRITHPKKPLHSLPASIGDLALLQELDLGENELNTLPETITNLKGLTKLDIHGNRLFPIPWHITRWLWVLKTHGCSVKSWQ
ncbi:MAG TPA: hypothetical protein VKM55_29750 [Candidatus Lokiarchaeia archaeon]|nr:hypothetical protein [Candidatus Lokiarchaeia archaeon]